MNPLKIEFPSLGWKQILTARQEMLDAYDRAREQARVHEVETFHGRVAEAACRKWLAEFLPKRYGVTSGYIISPGLSSAQRAPHFDVIIYNQLDSPILWVEGGPDTSTQGRSLAVPVEHVLTVLEVKSHFSAQSLRDALAHLRDLLPLMQGSDAASERHHLYLGANFCCGVLFMDLRKEQAKSEAALSVLTSGMDLRGFFGGVVLRGEGHLLSNTGRLILVRSATPRESSLRHSESTLLDLFATGRSVALAENAHIGPMLMWSESGFAAFAFDVVAMLNGTYNPEWLSSRYGIGTTAAELEREFGVTRPWLK